MATRKRPINKLSEVRINALMLCEQHTGHRFPLYDQAAKDLGLNSRQHVFDVLSVLRDLELVDAKNQITSLGRQALVMGGEMPAQRSKASR